MAPGPPWDLDARSYRRLQVQARRLTLSEAEAEDLVQETLLAAWQAGRCDPPWLAGTMRRQAAMSVRGAVRRRLRERRAGLLPAACADPADAQLPDVALLLQRLPRSARQVAALALQGLSAAEIRWILRIAPPAFRQRLVTIRRTMDALAPAQRWSGAELAALVERRAPAGLPLGPMRRALKAAMAARPALGAHDPDGHLLMVDARAHVSARRGNGNG